MSMQETTRNRALALAAYQAALDAVDPRRCVAASLKADARPVSCLAVGKAARGMLAGAAEVLGERLVEALLIVPDEAPDEAPGEDRSDPRIRCLVGEHPVPGAGSLRAGTEALAFLRAIPAGHRFLALVSGGASALMERPAEGVSETAVLELHAALAGLGLDIAAMNAVRCAYSAIKDGGLARALPGHARADAEVLVISDVPEDEPAVVGSGPFLTDPGRAALAASVFDTDAGREILTRFGPPPALDEAETGSGMHQLAHRPPHRPRHRLIAHGGDAAAAASRCLSDAGRRVEPVARLTGDAQETGERLGDALLGMAPGRARVLHGETTVALAGAHGAHGRGGRCQHLALAAACRIRGLADSVLLAAGTDGRDGPDGPAGALVDGGSIDRGQDAGLNPGPALAGLDAGSFLAEAGDLVDTGATGTNVADLVIMIRGGEV